MSVRLGELAERIGARLRGDPDRSIRDVAPLDRAGAEELSFFTNPRYRRAAESTHAGAVLVRPGTDLDGPDLLEVADPYVALAEILEIFHPPRARRPGVHRDSRVDPSVRIGDEVEVGPFAVIGALANHLNLKKNRTIELLPVMFLVGWIVYVP